MKTAEQRKENEQAGRKANQTASEAHAPAEGEVGAWAGMPMFLKTAHASGFGAPHWSYAPKPAPVQRQLEDEEEEEELLQPSPPYSSSLQGKLAVGPPDDEYEQEADQVAETVTRALSSESVSLKRLPQGNAFSPAQGESNQTLSAPAFQGDSGAIKPKGPGRPLPPFLQSRLGGALGADLRQVRVHTDAQAAQSARSIDARAYTIGPDIVFGKDQYSPDTTAGLQLLIHEMVHVVQQSAQAPLKGIQRKPRNDADNDTATSGELAWELFSPVAMGGVRSLAPGALKATKVGRNYEEVIDIVDKLEGSVKKIADYEKKIKEISKGKTGKGGKFTLKSLGKVNAHFQSIPDAIEIDADKLINEAGQIVTSDMFTQMPDAVARLQSFASIVKETKRLRYPYRRMAEKLSQAEARITASFDALGVLEDTLLDLAKYAVLPVFQVEMFSQSQLVHSYRSDVGTLLDTVRNKRKGYEEAVAASEAMEAYMSGKAGRKGIEKRYREPEDAVCLKRLEAALPALKNSLEAMYEEVLPYSECTFEHIMDALDFLPIEETDGFFAVKSGLRDAYPDRKSEIERKEGRYVAGLTLYAKLLLLRPILEKIEAKLDPIVLPFVFQEYYRFWVDAQRSLLSNTHFTYLFQIKQMSKNVDLLLTAVLISDYFETR